MSCAHCFGLDEVLNLGRLCSASSIVCSSRAAPRSSPSHDSEPSQPASQKRHGSSVPPGTVPHWLAELDGTHTPTRVQDALTRLADVCASSPDPDATRRTLYRAGGHATLVRTLQHGLSCPHTSRLACRCLYHATQDDPTMAIYQEEFVQAGALAVLMRVLQRHASREPVQRAACKAVYALVQDHEPHAQQLMQSRMGIQPLIASLKAFPTRRRLQQWGCMTLDTLSQWDSLKEALVQSGAMVVLATALANYSTTPHDATSPCDGTMIQSARRAIHRLSTAAILQPVVIEPWCQRDTSSPVVTTTLTIPESLKTRRVTRSSSLECGILVPPCVGQ